VSRPRLLTELSRGVAARPVTLVSGPAGAGKSVVAASWLELPERANPVPGQLPPAAPTRLAGPLLALPAPVVLILDNACHVNRRDLTGRARPAHPLRPDAAAAGAVRSRRPMLPLHHYRLTDSLTEIRADRLGVHRRPDRGASRHARHTGARRIRRRTVRGHRGLAGCPADRRGAAQPGHPGRATARRPRRRRPGPERAPGSRETTHDSASPGAHPDRRGGDNRHAQCAARRGPSRQLHELTADLAAAGLRVSARCEGISMAAPPVQSAHPRRRDGS
jgi:hypothetical protein